MIAFTIIVNAIMDIMLLLVLHYNSNTSSVGNMQFTSENIEVYYVE